MKILAMLFLTLAISCVSLGQGAGSELQQFIRTTSNVVALTHVRVIDGTGAAPTEDQTILIVDGKITEIHPSKDVQVKEGIKALDLTGYTVLPGLVGMHDHMFFPMGGSPPMYWTWDSVFRGSIWRSASPRFARPAASSLTSIWKSRS